MGKKLKMIICDLDSCICSLKEIFASSSFLPSFTSLGLKKRIVYETNLDFVPDPKIETFVMADGLSKKLEAARDLSLALKFESSKLSITKLLAHTFALLRNYRRLSASKFLTIFNQRIKRN